MTRKRALAVFAAVTILLVAVNAVIYSLYRTEVETVSRALDDRLVALGTTTARWLQTSPAASTDQALLAALASENQLEDVYIVDPALRVRAGVRTAADSALNLMRADEERLGTALAGRATIGDGYSIDNARIEVGYFPFVRAGEREVLALEAGAEYRAPTTQLYTTYVLAVGLTVLVALVFACGLGLALQALERARLAHGRAERLAAVGQMAAMVAHEVRNPLGILRGQVELARERLGPVAPARVQDQFVEMLAEIERINTMTEDFMGLARDAPLDVAPLELGALLTELVAAARVATETGAVISLEPLAAPIHMDGDAARLRQAIFNLVLNAVQVGGPTVHVRVEAVRVGGDVRISVSDDGPGVPPEVASRIAEPFVSGREGGTGLGLTIARRIAERHGGGLELDPSVRRGARFSLQFPITRGSV